MIDAATYAAERAICDKAAAYAEQFRQRNGWIVIPADAAKHPDYAACDNAMRGRIELYELHRDKPERFSAYVVDNGEIATWPGDVIGKVTHRSTLGTGWTWRSITVRTAWGVTYRGREYASMQLVSLRRIAA